MEGGAAVPTRRWAVRSHPLWSALAHPCPPKALGFRLTVRAVPSLPPPTPTCPVQGVLRAQYGASGPHASPGPCSTPAPHFCPLRRVFAGAVEAGGTVRAIRVPDGKRISNSRIKPKGDVANEAVAGGAAGLAYIRVLEDGAIEAAKPIKEGLNEQQV